jgi:hypothetical protein
MVRFVPAVTILIGMGETNSISVVDRLRASTSHPEEPRIARLSKVAGRMLREARSRSSA